MMYQNTQVVAIIVCILKKASYRCHLNKGVKQTDIKGSVQWKNDLGLYCSLVVVMNIGMCDLVISCLVYPLQEF